uniref:uncharacterized protein LOC130486464 n=1 Tax=Euleptes europaea TaxID=460621 RepID=UPI002541B021|nr:uncharacterized protein LOC130486464 [Euleptes europaea]
MQALPQLTFSPAPGLLTLLGKKFDPPPKKGCLCAPFNSPSAYGDGLGLGEGGRSPQPARRALLELPTVPRAPSSGAPLPAWKAGVAGGGRGRGPAPIGTTGPREPDDPCQPPTLSEAPLAPVGLCTCTPLPAPPPLLAGMPTREQAPRVCQAPQQHPPTHLPIGGRPAPSPRPASPPPASPTRLATRLAKDAGRLPPPPSLAPQLGARCAPRPPPPLAAVPRVRAPPHLAGSKARSPPRPAAAPAPAWPLGARAAARAGQLRRAGLRSADAAHAPPGPHSPPPTPHRTAMKPAHPSLRPGMLPGWPRRRGGAPERPACGARPRQEGSFPARASAPSWRGRPHAGPACLQESP